MASEGDSKKLLELRVIDLRSELEKRGLDKSGNKQTLIERLQKALTDEGNDPETYQFDTSDKKVPKRPSNANLSDNESKLTGEDQEMESEKNLEGKEIPKKTDKLTDNGEKISEDKSKDGNENKEYDVEKDKDDSENVIHLNLEEEESFHDDEPEGEEKSTGDGKEKKKDEKNSSHSKTQDGFENNSTSITTKEEEKNKEKAEKESSNIKPKSGAKMLAAKSRNLWITNISQNTRATELKQALSEFGKVIGAKVVINAKYPGACCYGYVTMETAEDADNCIAKLNNTELNGQIIKIEKVRTDHMNMKTRKPEKEDGNAKISHEDPDKLKKEEEKKDLRSDKEKDGKDKDTVEKSTVDIKDDTRSTSKKPESLSGKSDHKKRSRSPERHRTRDRDRSREQKRSRSRSRRDRSISSKSRLKPKEKEVLTFNKIKQEHERQRLREKERILREESRRRREEALRQREIERQQRSEAARLEREREKLRIEREKLEREKAEIIRLERERQKLEREKLELEKLELQRAKLRLQEEDRRPVKRPATYREDTFEDRKRVVGDRRYDEAPPAPRYDNSSTIKAPSPPRKIASKTRSSYEKHESFSKRDREYDSNRTHTSSISRGPPPPNVITKYEGSSIFSISRERDVREGRSREGNSSSSTSNRYERDRDRSPHFRGRDDRERRPVPDHKTDVRSRDHRYDAPSKDSGRFENRGGNNWSHSGNSSNKPFNSNSSSTTGNSKAWSKDSWRTSDSSGQDRWSSSNASRSSGSLSSAFGNNSNLNLTPSCPPPPGINSYSSDRFEYKSMSGMRKY